MTTVWRIDLNQEEFLFVALSQPLQRDSVYDAVHHEDDSCPREVDGKVVANSSE